MVGEGVLPTQAALDTINHRPMTNRNSPDPTDTEVPKPYKGQSLICSFIELSIRNRSGGYGMV